MHDGGGAFLRPLDDRPAGGAVGGDGDADGGLFGAHARLALASDGDDDGSHGASIRDRPRSLSVSKAGTRGVPVASTGSATFPRSLSLSKGPVPVMSRWLRQAQPPRPPGSLSLSKGPARVFPVASTGSATSPPRSLSLSKGPVPDESSGGFDSSATLPRSLSLSKGPVPAASRCFDRLSHLAEVPELVEGTVPAVFRWLRRLSHLSEVPELVEGTGTRGVPVASDRLSHLSEVPELVEGPRYRDVAVASTGSATFPRSLSLSKGPVPAASRWLRQAQPPPRGTRGVPVASTGSATFRGTRGVPVASTGSAHLPEVPAASRWLRQAQPPFQGTARRRGGLDGLSHLPRYRAYGNHGAAGSVIDGTLGCFGPEVVTQQRDDGRSFTEFPGLIGFDSACEPARSGPRMWGYLVKRSLQNNKCQC